LRPHLRDRLLIESGVLTCDHAKVKWNEFETEREVRLFLLVLFPVLVVLAYFMYEFFGSVNWFMVISLPVLVTAYGWFLIRQQINDKAPRVPPTESDD
jgi:hypothetical protein